MHQVKVMFEIEIQIFYVFSCWKTFHTVKQAFSVIENTKKRTLLKVWDQEAKFSAAAIFGVAFAVGFIGLVIYSLSYVFLFLSGTMAIGKKVALHFR